VDVGSAAGGARLDAGGPDAGADGVALGVTGVAGDGELLGLGECEGRADRLGMAEPVGLGDRMGEVVEGVDLGVGDGLRTGWDVPAGAEAGRIRT